MTLDEAQEAFHEKPTKSNATNYHATAIEYFNDGMIGWHETMSIAVEVSAWLEEHGY